MFGGNFQTWKLHSAQDYFMFFAYILAGVMVFWLIAKHMNKQRNHEKAVEKVSARLKKICGKPGEVLKNATLNLPEGKMTFDAVLMDKRGVYLVRTYGWGIKIYIACRLPESGTTDRHHHTVPPSTEQTATGTRKHTFLRLRLYRRFDTRQRVRYRCLVIRTCIRREKGR